MNSTSTLAIMRELGGGGRRPRSQIQRALERGKRRATTAFPVLSQIVSIGEEGSPIWKDERLSPRHAPTDPAPLNGYIRTSALSEV
jgi:hypothetical protein